MSIVASLTCIMLAIAEKKTNDKRGQCMQTMSQRFYTDCNQLKFVFRKHHCNKCGNRLKVIKHRAVVVDDQSDRAEYYAFKFGMMNYGVGPCEFVHDVFYCQNCEKIIEPLTQLSLEDVDKVISKVVAYFAKKGREIRISKTYETLVDEVLDYYQEDKFINCLQLTVTEKNKETKVYKLAIRRREHYNRPFYFKLTKKELVEFIEN